MCVLLTGAHAVAAEGVVFKHPSPVSRSVSLRLAKRIGLRFAAPVLPEVAAGMIAQKNDLHDRSITIHFHDEKHPEKDPLPVELALAGHGEWIVYDQSHQQFKVDERSVRYFLEELQAQILPAPSYPIATVGESYQLSIQGTAQEGYRLDTVSAADAITDALMNGDTSVSIVVGYQEPSLFFMTDAGVKELPLLSRGMSDFAKSPAGRDANIRRALDVYLNGIVVMPGEDFSFNTAFEQSYGWSEALVIAEGGTLVSEPGGGICQTASTVFRAALLAGLPIVKRANHSLYVGYYEEYGVGLDATIYPGKQDFVFTNDTSAPVIVAARHDGTKAIVEFYGKSDGRTVSLDGPFFSTTNEGFDKKLSIKQIGWNYGVTYPDGHTVTKPIVSTYTMLPKLLREKYATAQGVGLLSELAVNPAEQVVMRY